MHWWIICLLLLTACEGTLLDVRRILSLKSDDPDEIWEATRGEDIYRANASVQSTHTLMVIFSALVASPHYRRGSHRWEIVQRDFCNTRENLIGEIIFHEYYGKWKLRWRTEWELWQIGNESDYVDLITPFWNFDKVCPLIVDDNVMIFRIVVLQRLFKNLYLSENSRRTDAYKISVVGKNTFSESLTELGRTKFVESWHKKFIGRVSVEKFNGGFSSWISTVIKGLVEIRVLVPTESGTNFFTLNWAEDIDEKYFIFIGKILGLCLIEDQFLPIQLSVGISKYLLDESAISDELEQEYPSVYKYLEELDFENSEIFFGDNLLSGGKSLRVTRENVLRYDRLMATWRLIKSIKTPLTFVKTGLMQILGIPRNDLIRNHLPDLLTARELQYIFSGPADPVRITDIAVEFDWSRWGAATWTESEKQILIYRMEKFFEYLDSERRIGDFLEKLTGNRFFSGKPIVVALRSESGNPDLKSPKIVSREGRLTIPLYSSDEIFIRKMIELL